MRIQRYIGVDFGEKRIGLAIADDDARMAVPHRVFQMSDKPEGDMEHLSIIIKGEADIIIVGLPLTREGTEGPMAKRVREFAEDLQFRTDLPLHFQDERLTTRENYGLLQGYPTEERKRLLDALAAASILQTWLDKTKSRIQPGEEKKKQKKENQEP
jgi:putative Holliday junction resolvase